MPSLGGESEKYGNRFEGKWTVFCLAQLLAEESNAIRLEPPGVEGEGCEFVVTTGPTKQYHQVKRQHAELGEWSIPKLRRNGVLSTALKKTLSPNAEFVFVSTVSANMLSELTDAARKAETVDEFLSNSLTGHKRKAWEQLLRVWGPLIEEIALRNGTVSSEEKTEAIISFAYQSLCRTHIIPCSEDLLTEMVNTKLRTLVRGDPDTIRERLAAYASENVPKTIFADELWGWMSSRGYRRVDYANDMVVLASIEELNKRYERMFEPINDDISIARTEADTILGILQSREEKNSVLVSGVAGIGKTVILGQAIRRIRELGIPHLYFPVDRLDPTELPQNVGAQLGLPGSPVEVLANVAGNRTSVLIIDQLDAVSWASGRSPEFFGCIHEIIRQAKAFPVMRLLMACRQFDLSKDNRLRELVSETGPAQEVKAELFPIETVKSALGKLGYKSPDFSERQLELWRLPLHLSLLAEISRDGPLPLLRFGNAIDLFAAYWEKKRLAVALRMEDRPDQWMQVIDRLCDRMTTRQALFVPEEVVLDDFAQTVRAMESEHVLVLDGRQIGFFHEEFFDYVFARLFVSEGRDLIEYLKGGGQHLFKRAPLRQILLYEYGIDYAAFIENLRKVLTDAGIRLHLKKSALDVVGRLDKASKDLWELLKDIIENENASLAKGALTSFVNCRSLFPFIHESGVLTGWLASDDPSITEYALRIIQVNLRANPVECIDYLRPYIGESAEWNRRILFTIWSHIKSTRLAFELLIAMADKGLVEEEGAASFWPFLEELPRTNPQWATEAINSYLARVTEDIDFKNIPMRFMPGRSTGGIRFLLDTAKAAPLAFLKVAIPFFLRVVTETADKRARELYSDSVWHIRMFREDQSEMESAFLKALEISLCQLARTSRPEFERLFERLRSYGDYDSVNYLLVRALTVAPSDSADLTVEYVLENLQRLEAGWIGIRNSQYWAARELIEHCSKTCSEKSYSRLQEAMLQHYPLWEKSRDGHRYNGYWQFIMLDALDRERRSEAVEIRIRELQRKFQPKVLKPLTLPQGGIVESPIDETLVRKMSDEQWLRAMNIYDKKDGSSQRSSRSFLAGGARELAAELEKETNHNPERFARLVLRMPVGLQPCYFQAILRGLGGAPIDKDLVFDVVRTVFGLEGKPGGHWLLGPIESLSGEDIPEDILKIVGWLATEADDPRLSEVVITAVKGSEPTSPSEILNAAINSTRGSAAVGMGSLLFDCSNRVPFFLPYIRRMVCDPTVIVRSAVANTLLGLFRHDEERAVELFLQLVEIDVDELFATPYVDKFLYYASYRHFTRLMPVIRRMLDSRSGFVREAGARQACLAQFDNPEALDLVVECISGDDDKRTGAAKVAAANVSNEKCRDFSHSALVRFFDDPIKEVRAEAASFFQKVEGRQLEACRRLIRAFLASRAFSENMEVLIRSLERSTANIPEELLAACEAIVTELDRCGWNMRYRTLAHAGTICELVLRAYRQSRDDGYRTRCLDLIDRLVGLEVYGIEEELREFER